MKRFLLFSFILLSLIPDSYSNNTKWLKGYWYENFTGDEIRIKSRRNYLRVKGISRSSNWIRFDRMRNGNFRDCRGNIIIVRSRHSLQLIPRRGGQKIFTRFGNRQFRDQKGCRPSSYQNSRYRSLHNFKREQFYVHILNEYIDVRYENNLLFARRYGGDWSKYIQNPYRKNEYIDNQGNRYIRDSKGNLSWTRSDGQIDLYLERRNTL